MRFLPLGCSIDALESAMYRLLYILSSFFARSIIQFHGHSAPLKSILPLLSVTMTALSYDNRIQSLEELRGRT